MHERVAPTESTTPSTRETEADKEIYKGTKIINKIGQEIAKFNCPGAAKVLLKPVHEKISKSRQSFVQSKVRSTLEPQLVAIYFKNVGRSRLGAVRQAPQKSLRSWALLGTDFAGALIKGTVHNRRL